MIFGYTYEEAIIRVLLGFLAGVAIVLLGRKA